MKRIVTGGECHDLQSPMTVVKTRNWKAPALRLAVFLMIAAGAGTLLNGAACVMSRDGYPAGLTRGMVEGALMPMAWPNLLFGRDVPIYSAVNAGISYKLGYTVGVNLCGALFFGVLYWRLSRWHKRQSGLR